MAVLTGVRRDSAEKGFALLCYLRDFHLNPPQELWNKARGVEVESQVQRDSPRTREVISLSKAELECLGRAAQRCGNEMINLIYELSCSWSGDLALCTRAERRDPKFFHRGAEKVKWERRVLEEDCEKLYYYFLDEIRRHLYTPGA